MSNQSLKEGTTGETELTNLASRSGDSLEINSTDKVTVSYVQAGKTHTTTFQVGYKDAAGADKIHTLQDIFNAAEDIDKNSDIFANQANDSVLAAQGIKGNDADTIKGNVKTAMEHKTKEAETFKDSEDEAAQKGVTKASIQTLIDAYNTANAGAKITVKADDYGSVTEFTEALKADASYTGATAGTELTALKTEVAKMTKSAAWKTADTAYTAADRKTLEAKLLTGSTVGLAASNDTVDTASGKDAITITANTAGIGGQISGFNISITDSKGNVKKSANAALDAFEETIRAQNKSDDNAISLQVGAKANQSIKVGLTDMRAEALGLQGADGTKLNISTQTKANAAINVLDNAIQKALDQQTTIGSVESRLEYTSTNLTTASENVQASESTIRDADMAKEMTNYTKNNVLLQAVQSMLAQANQFSSNVLSLLQ